MTIYNLFSWRRIVVGNIDSIYLGGKYYHYSIIVRARKIPFQAAKN